ncbi:MAG: hypothetical protein KC493_16510 [Bacteriovoracaceae bacterium]|nr:hypothetical protein [Bacteriovoracaceae bacterium]
MTSNFSKTPRLNPKKKLKVVGEDNDILEFTMVDGVKIETVNSYLLRGGTIEVYAYGTRELIEIKGGQVQVNQKKAA